MDFDSLKTLKMRKPTADTLSALSNLRYPAKTKWPPNRGFKIKIASIKLKSIPNRSHEYRDSENV